MHQSVALHDPYVAPASHIYATRCEIVIVILYWSWRPQSCYNSTAAISDFVERGQHFSQKQRLENEKSTSFISPISSWRRLGELMEKKSIKSY